MNLREVREVAELYSEGIKPDIDVIVGYILATIDPEPDLPITGKWLREEWGFEYREAADEELYLIRPGVTFSMLQDDDNNSWTFYLDSDSGDYWPHDLHTRQQFCDLARCLDIPRRKETDR